MDQELEQLKKDMDCWVKQINKQMNSMKIEGSMIQEMGHNVQHNYELIMEIRSMVTEMKLEINALKLIQIMSIQIMNERGELTSKIQN